jgi:hypothetical protein
VPNFVMKVPVESNAWMRFGGVLHIYIAR